MRLPIVKFSWTNGATYQSIWDLQTSIHKRLIANKLEWRDLDLVTRHQNRQVHELIFCEHNHVFTLGKSGSMDHLLLSEAELKGEDIEFFKINRGGDITYHGPGQITGYPIFDMDEFYTDIHKYVRELEECIMRCIGAYGLEGIRLAEHTGVWLPPRFEGDQYRKICAIGVHLSRWVTMHGFAFNVNTDLSYFDKIVPCGIIGPDKGVTSLSNELGQTLDIKRVGEELKGIFADQFMFKYL